MPQAALALPAVQGNTLLACRSAARRGASKVARAFSVSASAKMQNSSASRYGELTFDTREDFKRVLAIDGGGLRGLIPAALLEGLEEVIKQTAVEKKLLGRDMDGKTVTPSSADDFDVNLNDYFDVTAGTSTGSILATYIASRGSQAKNLLSDAGDAYDEVTAVKEKVSGRKVLPPNKNPGSSANAQALFFRFAEEIFPTAKLPKPLHNLFHPKYSADGVEKVLKLAFGNDDVLVSAPGVLTGTNLVVTSYQIDYDRPFVFYYDDGLDANGDKGATPPSSGYATLRRTLTVDEESKAETEGCGLSDIVRVPNQQFSLWQLVRASTAAPTYFPLATVDNTRNVNHAGELSAFSMTDGGVVANNPSMVAMTFATGKYNTNFVATEPGKPSIAVLSLGCGTCAELSGVAKDAGQLAWITGPLFDIVSSGAGELTAALNQNIYRMWPGSKALQWMRLQLTAGVLPDRTQETLSYMDEVIREGQNSPQWQPFENALNLGDFDDAKDKKANAVLSQMDQTARKEQLLGLGYAMAQDPQVQKRLRTWVEQFIL